MRRSWMLVMLLCALSVSTPAHADDKSYRALVLEYFEMADMAGLMKRSIDVMIQAQVQGNPGLAQFAPKLREFFAKYMGWESVREEFVAVYQRGFTEAEFKELVAFYKTPVGKKALQQMPKMMEEGAQIGARRVQDHMTELQQMLMQSAKPAGH